MSNVNVIEELINFSKMVKKYDMNNIITEGPENCQHNNSKIYYQGIINHKKTKYFAICYENCIEDENIKKLFEISNKNLTRGKNSIATMGLGIKLIFHKVGKKINVLSLNDDNISFTRLNLLKHMKEVLKTSSDNLEILHARNCITESFNDWDEFEEDHGKISTIVSSIKENIMKVNINPPRSYIIIELDEKTEEECIKSHNFCERIFGTKFNYNLNFEIYLFNLDVNQNEFTINQVVRRDILGLKHREDSATFYVKYLARNSRKNLNDHCIVYLKEGSKKIFFKRTSNGPRKKCTWKSVETEYLKTECNKIDSYDYSINFYRIKPRYFEKIKSDNIITNDIGDTGVYLMTSKDRNLINFKPNSWYNYCKQTVGRHDYWSERSRLVIDINNKDYFDVRGIKIETKPTLDTARLIQDCFEIFKKTKSYITATKRASQGGGSNYNTICKSTISIKELKDIFINKPKVKKHIKPIPPPPPPKPINYDEGYIYAIFDKTRPKFLKLGKSSFNYKKEEVRIDKGYCMRHYPLGTDCIKCIKVSNRHVAEKQLFEKCKKEKIGNSEWFNKDNIIKSIDNGLFETIAKSLQPI